MSILIKGMEMPTNCGFCLFEKHTDDGYECCINRCLTEYQKRPDDCPLVNIPDHGRLIDADALVHDLGAEDQDIYCEYVVENAPTIIQASGGAE